MSKDDYVGVSSTGLEVAHKSRDQVRITQNKVKHPKSGDLIPSNEPRELTLTYDQAYYLKEMLVSFLGVWEPE